MFGTNRRGKAIKGGKLDTNTMIVIAAVLVVAVILLLALVGRTTARKQKSEELRQRFGPEYDHAVEQYGDPQKAEEELAAREKRVKNLELHSLTPQERDRFAQAWKAAQTRFVDEPSAAVNDADHLVEEVMRARGYPTGDFEQRAADISVDHAGVITNYRQGHEIAIANRQGKASTEDLRQAMVRYRSLFDELLQAVEQPREKVKEMVR